MPPAFATGSFTNTATVVMDDEDPTAVSDAVQAFDLCPETTAIRRSASEHPRRAAALAQIGANGYYMIVSGALSQRIRDSGFEI